MPRRSLLTVLFAFFVSLSAFAASTLRVDSLRVEHLKNPSTLDTPHPRLSWANIPVSPTLRCLSQKAYRIAIASSEENLAQGTFDVWDTRKVASSNNYLIPYEGPALQSGGDYWWQVKVWDQSGKESEWSKPARWSMGLLQADEWKARWIQDPKNASAPLFRKKFELPRTVKKAKAYVCGLGFFELYVNGQRIGEDVLVPNLTNYSKREGLENYGIAIPGNFRDYRTLYLAYDITPQLREGGNAIGVILGNGFYTCGWRTAPFGARPCMICQVEISYDDGSRELLVSDDSWLTAPSPITTNGIYDGEKYDARKERPRWADYDEDESTWASAEIIAGPTGKLTAHASPTDKMVETHKPLLLEKNANGSYDAYFPEEISGWIRLKDISGTAGSKVTIKYHSESHQGAAVYTFKGGEKECYAPRFTWYTFSRVTIQGVENLTPDQVQAEAVNTDVPLTATFRTSNPLFNQINRIWQRSQLDNMHGCIASDCPHRERLPYTGDGQAAMDVTMHNFDAAAFYQKWIRDMRDTQNPETGYVPNSAPWQPGCGGGVPWGAAMNIMPWEFYLHYGDLKILEDNFDAMKDQVRHMLTWLTPDSIMHQHMGNVHTPDQPNEWLNLGDWCPAFGMPRREVVHTYYLWHCADYTAKAAKALGKKDDQQYYENLAARIKHAFVRQFYHPDHNAFGENSENIFALDMQLPANVHADAVAGLKNDVEAHGGHLISGYLGNKLFFEILGQNGLNELAYEAMSKDDYPSFGLWLKQGATTTWEQWDGGNSHNHPFQGGGLTWFYRTLAGVNTDVAEPGYRHIIFRPVLYRPRSGEPLREVRYSNATPYGNVSSEITQQADAAQFTLTVPVGAYATAYLPCSDLKAATESGRPLKKAKGVKIIKATDGQIVLQLQQGTYRLRLPQAQPDAEG